jgi:hypothetical protein
MVTWAAIAVIMSQVTGSAIAVNNSQHPLVQAKIATE